jgi:hypothetical protein
VLLKAVSPGLLSRLASGGGPHAEGVSASRRRRVAWATGGGWRGALGRSLNHAERGAALAEAAGSTAETVRLIRLHRSPPGDDVALAVLQAADDAS